jgi:hypothetical protein
MTARLVLDDSTGGRLAQNMSAPPRSTVSFQPYGTARPRSGDVSPATATGLRLRLRASVRGIVEFHDPRRGKRIERLGRQVSDLAHKRDPAVVPVRDKYHDEMLHGLIAAVCSLDGTTPSVAKGHDREQLIDLITERVSKLPRPDLPAMGAVNRLGSYSALDSTVEEDRLLSGLWLLTHINGDTFDRDGQAMLVASPFASSVYELYIC